MSLVYGSVCSGIEAATVAAHPLGWRPAFYSEIEPFPRAVLTHHYPQVPLHGDFTTINSGEYEPIDLLVGGTPCQSFSVAGLRGGLDDDRGNLALEYLRLADRLRPRWMVWENVPGVLSSNGGRDFGSILGGMGELGYGVAYRVLDAQYFGLAQRRRRVFVVGYLGDWRRAAAVLLERHSLSGNPAPSREAREGSAPSPSLRARANSSHRADSQAFIPDIGYALNAHGGAHGGAHGRQDAESETLIATTLRARDMARGVDSDCTDTLIAHTLKGEGFDASEDGTGRGTPIIPVTYSIMPQNSGKDYKARPVDVAQPLMASGPVGGNQGGDYIVHAIQAGALRENPESGPDGIGVQADHAYTLEARAEVQAVAFALRGREGGAMPEVGGDHVGALRSASGGSSRDYVAYSPETMYGVSYGTPPETGPDKALRALRDASDEEAFSQWGLGIDAAFRAAEVLRPEVHGEGVRRAPDDRDELGDDALSRPQTDPAGAVFALWKIGCLGRPPRGWQPPERLARELVAHLSKLPRQGTPDARFMLGMWRASEGLGPLRKALSETEAAWRSAQGDHQGSADVHGLRGAGAQSGPLRAPLHASQTGEGAGLLRSEVGVSAVRRLTPRLRECERLQGFPDDYTLIPWRKGLAPDGPRYKALGNSMAVPCMAWIFQRIAAVEALPHEDELEDGRSNDDANDTLDGLISQARELENSNQGKGL